MPAMPDPDHGGWRGGFKEGELSNCLIVAVPCIRSNRLASLISAGFMPVTLSDSVRVVLGPSSKGAIKGSQLHTLMR